MLQSFLKKYKILIATILAIVFLLSFSIPCYAVANPDSITLYTAKAFENIFHDGDMLFVVRYNIDYATEPTEDADYTFTMNIVSADGSAILASRPINYYQHNVISIYVSDTLVTSLGLVYGSAYKVRISGSPAFFVPLTETINMATKPLSPTDWNTDGALTSLELLRSHCIDIAEELESDWSIVLLTTTTSGSQVLNSSGAIVFQAAIPNLDNVLPNLFYLSSGSVVIDSNDITPLQESDTTIQNKLGTPINNAFNGIADFLGVSDQMASGLWIMLFVLSVMSIIFLGSGNSTGAMVLSVPIIVMGAYLGAIPMSILYTVGMFIVAYMFYFIWLRGT